MGMLNMDDFQSVRDRIEQDTAEIKRLEQGIYPHYSVVPVDCRERYVKIVKAHKEYLMAHLIDMVRRGL
tara:strand:+ start:117 stop:323 length:207 start_codon:yes stop_codon:yes gene_type:complete